MLIEKIKEAFWDFIARRWAPTRDFLLRHHIIWHEPGRQRFHIGWLREDKTPDEFMHHLQDIGFHNHSLAWVDEEEYFGLRIKDPGNKNFQYHLRLFNDMEIRGHYEYTTEASWHKHFWEIDMEERREKFLELLGDWIILKKADSNPQSNASGKSSILGVKLKSVSNQGK